MPRARPRTSFSREPGAWARVLRVPRANTWRGVGLGIVYGVTTPSASSSYAAAGVDTAAGDLAVELMKQAVSATHTSNVLGGFGGLAGPYCASFLNDLPRPLLAIIGGAQPSNSRT